MATLNEQDSNLVRITDQILNEELLSPHSLTMTPDFDDIDGMRQFAVAASAAMGIARTVEETRNALREAGAAFTAAHEAAAAIVVTELSESELNEFTEKLEALNEDIKDDERFDKALQLSQAMVSTLESFP